MENKQQIIKLLEECVKLQTEAIPLYSQYLDTPEFFEDLPPGDVERVKKALKILADDAKSHKDIFQSLLAKLKDPSKHVH